MCGIGAVDDWRRDDRGYDCAGEAGEIHGDMGDGAVARSGRWTCCWRILDPGQGVEMGVLGDCDSSSSSLFPHRTAAQSTH